VTFEKAERRQTPKEISWWNILQTIRSYGKRGLQEHTLKKFIRSDDKWKF
jgi:hypothetical protein